MQGRESHNPRCGRHRRRHQAARWPPLEMRASSSSSLAILSRNGSSGRPANSFAIARHKAASFFRDILRIDSPRTQKPHAIDRIRRGHVYQLYQFHWKFACGRGHRAHRSWPISKGPGQAELGASTPVIIEFDRAAISLDHEPSYRCEAAEAQATEGCSDREA